MVRKWIYLLCLFNFFSFTYLFQQIFFHINFMSISRISFYMIWREISIKHNVFVITARACKINSLVIDQPWVSFGQQHCSYFLGLNLFWTTKPSYESSKLDEVLPWQVSASPRHFNDRFIIGLHFNSKDNIKVIGKKVCFCCCSFFYVTNLGSVFLYLAYKSANYVNICSYLLGISGISSYNTSCALRRCVFLSASDVSENDQIRFQEAFENSFFKNPYLFMQPLILKTFETLNKKALTFTITIVLGKFFASEIWPF